ncbi:Fe(2+) transporter, partial [Linnemannia elongata]
MTQAEVDYDYEALPENASLTACLLAGAFAGVAEHAVMYPVDSIKDRHTEWIIAGQIQDEYDQDQPTPQ